LNGSPVDTTLAVANTAVLSHVLTTAEKALQPFTIVRTRGIFRIRSDQSIATEIQMASLGISVVSAQAVAIGVSAVPTPATDRASDLFFVYESLTSALRFISGVGFEEQSGVMMQFDSKAMRKVDEGADVAVVQESESVSAGLNALIAFRMLIKLH